MAHWAKGKEYVIDWVKAEEKKRNMRNKMNGHNIYNIYFYITFKYLGLFIFDMTYIVK